MAVPRALVGGGVGALFQDGAVVGRGSLRHGGCSRRQAGSVSVNGCSYAGLEYVGELVGGTGRLKK